LLRDFKKISAVICDTRATNMLGVDFLIKAANTAPSAALIMMTDPNRDEKPRDAAGRSTLWHTLEKPLMAGEVLSLLDWLVSGNGCLPPNGNSRDPGGKVIETELSQTNPDREFSMLYQPRICATTERTCSVEALLRWDNPSLGAVSPAHLIPVAEKTGDILWITDWTLQNACNTVRSWLNAGYDPIPVSVNISSKVCTDTRLIALAANAMRVSGITPDLLRLEIAEGFNLCGNERACANAAGLRELGVGVSVDGIVQDGHDLSTFKVKDVHCLHGRQALIGRVAGRSDTSILRAISDLGRKLGIKTVASGVESLQHAQFIRKLGFDQMQGFHISAPLTQADLPAWVMSRAPA